MRLRKAAGERRSSDRRSNSVSWISEIKDISSVTVRKKRGRRAPPSAKRLRGKKVDEIIDSDDAVDDDVNDTDKGQVGTSQSVGHIEECVDGRTDDPDLSKRDQSDDSSDAASSAAEEKYLPTKSKNIIQSSSSQSKEKVPEKQMRRKQGKNQNALANDDGSDTDLAEVNKGTDEGRSSWQKKDDEVSDAQFNTTSSEDKSSEVIEDVKVCDICGDVGEEESLAVCSRCHDGAEHTYCMRVMMDEVPDSNWLCEDCQTAVEFEKKKKLEKCEVKVGTSKRQPLEGKMSRPFEAARSGSLDGKSEAENVDNKMLDIANEGNDTSNNRVEDDAVVKSSVGETLLEPGNIGADSRKIPPLSRESSFKFDLGKGKQVSQVATSLASTVPKIQAPQPRGLLSKSVSFNNSKVPKVKQLLNEVPQKPKILKESWSSAIKKDAPVGMTTKSATFKKPKPSEPTNKAKSSVLSTAEGTRGTDSLVGQKVTADRCTSILGCPSSTAAVVPPILSRAEATAPHVASGINMTDSNNLSTTPGECGKSILGNSELKKPLHVEGSTGILGPGAQRKIIQNSLHRDNKIKDPPGFRQGASSNRAIRCQRCNEVGHSTQFCAIDKPRLSAIKPLNERNLKEAYNKPSSISETSKLIATERTAPRSADQSEQILKYGAYQSPMPNYRRDESCQGFSTGGEQIPPTVPELDYIWQGGFELRRTGRSPELCDGFQAHLSCSASQLVLDVAKKFPSKVQLEELPRLKSWPAQFQQSGPTYNNVGLFFFARDAQSYENHYSKLVENMLKNDLVLRGTVDTVELLIFPSNILSKNFPRWNMFYFLWGVFRVSKKDYSSVPHDEPKCTGETNLNEGLEALCPTASVQSSSHSLSKDINNFVKSDPNLVKSAPCADNGLPSLEANHQECLNGANSLNQSLSGTAIDKSHDSVTARCPTNNNGAIGHSAIVNENDHLKLNYSEHQDKMCGSTSGNVTERDFDVNMVPDDCSMPLIYDEEPGKEGKTINLNDAEQVTDIDNAITVEVNTVTPDSVSHASGGARKRDFGIVDGADELDGALGHKKVKLDNVSASSGLCEVTDDGRLSSEVHPLLASSVDSGTGNKLMASTDGKCVFPLDLNAVDGVISRDIVNIPSSDDEDFTRTGVQRPEKEVGGDKSSEKAMLSPRVGEKQSYGNGLPTEGRSSLSLSLGFSSRKEQ